jgi:hypothetical protein
MPSPRKTPDPARRSIHVFDLDDTLIRTEAQVRVIDAEGREIRALTPAEFTTYALADGETFDFRDFGNVGLLARGVVLKYTRSIIETILARGSRSDFAILTARGDKRLHAPFLIRLFHGLFGIRLRNALIFNLSDERFLRHKETRELPEHFAGKSYAKLSVPERKALVIGQDLVARGYNDISLYDDSRENLNAFKVIHKAFPSVVYHPHFIDHTWKMRLQEFREADKTRKPLTSGRASALLLLEHHSRYGENPEAGLRALEERGEVRLGGGVSLVLKEGKYALVKTEAAGQSSLKA